ncbi:hypothetical protein AVEN_88855-1 [Araneus ventricosus]|uniref:Uncharacterized protein n=1 Tax=Araneus ventricosus TaxID=182803 RepID=A0A4Y2CN78_ARAVE|nr:hypothetical protein AVEN_88855-1 [Araneus ventricosus]
MMAEMKADSDEMSAAISRIRTENGSWTSRIGAENGSWAGRDVIRQERMRKEKPVNLVASPGGSAVAEVLQGIPADKLTDLTTIEKALNPDLETAIWTQFYRIRTEKKKTEPGESRQELAADVERLMRFSLRRCPLDVRKFSTSTSSTPSETKTRKYSNYRLTDAKDLKSSLAIV